MGSSRKRKETKGSTSDRKDQIKKYRKLSDEDRTRYELKWADSHGLGDNPAKGRHWKSRNLINQFGGEDEFDYTQLYGDVPLPSWMAKERKRLRKKGIDKRRYVAKRFAGGISGIGSLTRRSW
jgi:hypothetical protein